MSAAGNIAQVGGGLKNAAVGIGVLIVTAAVVYVGWKLYKGASAAVATAEDILVHDLNPASDQNLAYRGENEVIGCGDGSCSLGTKVYDAVQWFKKLGGQ